MRTRTTALITSGLLAAGAIGYGAAIVLDDPDRTVEAFPSGGFTTPTDASTTTAAPSASAPATTAGPETSSTLPDAPSQSVEGLEQLVGELRAGDDPDDWHVSGVDVDFGPDDWLRTGPVVADYDGDGTTEALLDELRGLEGQEVTLGVRFEVDDDGDDDDGDRDDADVYVINELTLRDPAGGVPPWHTPANGTEASRADVERVVLATVGDGARVTELEREVDADDWNGWEVEVHDASGQEYVVLVDVGGTVVDVRADHD